MKIYIGPYKDWVGPYQIANWLQKVGVSEDRCDKIGEYLANTWLNKFCNYIHNKKKIKMKIKIHDYDIWSMDYTLSFIILPMLKKLKEVQHGCPHIDDEDVPEGINLRSTEAPPKEHEWDTDDNFCKRWDWILDEMIWAFEQLVDDENDSKFFDHSEGLDKGLSFQESINKLKIDRVGLENHHKRIDNGLRLFGRYYRALWD